MFTEIRFAVGWCIAFAAIVLPFKIVLPSLLSLGFPPFFAFLSATAIALGALLGLGFLAMLAEERLGITLISKPHGPSNNVPGVIAIALCIGGGWAVIKVATASF